MPPTESSGASTTVSGHLTRRVLARIPAARRQAILDINASNPEMLLAGFGSGVEQIASDPASPPGNLVTDPSGSTNRKRKRSPHDDGDYDDGADSSVDVGDGAAPVDPMKRELDVLHDHAKVQTAKRRRDMVRSLHGKKVRRRTDLPVRPSPSPGRKSRSPAGVEPKSSSGQKKEDEAKTGEGNETAE